MGINHIYFHGDYDSCPVTHWGYQQKRIVKAFTTDRCSYSVECCRSCLVRVNKLIAFIKDIDPVIMHARSIERYIRNEKKHMEKNFDRRNLVLKAKWKSFLRFKREHESMSAQLSRYMFNELGEYLFYQWEKGLRLKGVKS